MRIEDTIYIDASPDVVWAVTEDVERWPEWTPTITSVKRVDAEGPLALLLWPVLRPAMQKALSAENQGLKARCEAPASSQA